MTPRHHHPVVAAGAARRLLLEGAGLLGEPSRRATVPVVEQVIGHMGFVQVDTINVVERAHLHILMTRLDGFRPDMLRRLMERDRRLFEQWTHDASIIPVGFFPQWHHRFRRFRRRWREQLRHHRWWQQRMGDNPQAVFRAVMRRIEHEGPLGSRHFDDDGSGAGPWWGWKRSKAALEILWRFGRLAVDRRENFHKLYDLTGRVLPDHVEQRAPSRIAHVQWACRSALERLGVATPAELAGFWAGVDVNEARGWCDRAVRRGDVEAVVVQPAGEGKPRSAVALPDWQRRVEASADPPDRLRLLSPFDPLIRDRARLQRLFGFEYRFEAFVPAAKRRYGYYVLPVLESDRFVARLDPKFHRDRGLLEIRGLWWEPGVRPTRKRRAALDEAVARFAQQIGAEHYEL